MKCTNCGNENQSGSKFCRFCGNVMPAEPVAPSPFVPSTPVFHPAATNPIFNPATTNPSFNPAAANPTFDSAAANPAPFVPPVAPDAAPFFDPIAPMGGTPVSEPQKKPSNPKIWIPIVAGVVVLRQFGL